MTYQIASVLCGKSRPKLAGVKRGGILFYDNSKNLESPALCYQKILKDATAEILIYVHSDLDIHEDLEAYDPNWINMILSRFTYPDCVVVGLGGAVGLGNPDLYRKPFQIQNMARRGYASNQTDAEVHGERFTGVRRVAVLDAFCLAARTEWLRTRGGWPIQKLTHHCLDLWLACEAARDSKETWMVGAECTHHGGGSSIGQSYAKARWLQGGSLEKDHLLPHQWLWDEYRDVLPIVVTR